MTALLEIRNLKKEFPVRKGMFQRIVGQVTAVNGVSISIEKGKTLGVVGESGCGKSTLAKMLVGLHALSDGEIIFKGEKLAAADEFSGSKISRHIQIVFQDPFSSLDPRVPVGHSIAEGLVIHKIGNAKSQRQAVADMLELVGLPPIAANRYPHEFSGGQRQRIGIARALIMKPDFVVCDEPTSALDVSVQAQILNLLKRLQAELDLTLMFISHNLSVIRHVADHVMVMYLGAPVEMSSAKTLFANPRHPYTQALLSATPIADPEKRSERIRLEGELPSPINPPNGCTFHPRCPLANDRCKREIPQFKTYDDASIACHAVEEGRNKSISLDN